MWWKVYGYSNHWPNRTFYPMIIINDVVIGTDTVLVSFDDDDDDVDTAVSMSFFSFALWLDDDALLMVLTSSSDRFSP